ncbi:MAG: RNA polymerase subunit sigma-70 [Planctomycetes bacterium]|nr:RNA polymerase subunit sigma-70 [Planctomycetota bacterium]
MSESPADPDDEARARLDALFPHLYDALRELAGQYLRRERDDHTLQPTAVVHEAYLRLRQSRQLDTHDRGAFMAAASSTIRRLLIDHARRAGADRRGGGWSRVTLQTGLLVQPAPDLDLIALDEAVTRLGQQFPRVGQVVELRVFCSMTHDEAASALDVTRRTIDRDWEFAKSWLLRELSRE